MCLGGQELDDFGGSVHRSEDDTVGAKPGTCNVKVRRARVK